MRAHRKPQGDVATHILKKEGKNQRKIIPKNFKYFSSFKNRTCGGQFNLSCMTHYYIITWKIKKYYTN